MIDISVMFWIWAPYTEDLASENMVVFPFNTLSREWATSQLTMQELMLNMNDPMQKHEWELTQLWTRRQKAKRWEDEHEHNMHEVSKITMLTSL